MNAQDVMTYGHLTVLQAVDGFDDGNWNEAGVCGVWSTRQIVAHLASYELVLADVLMGIVDGGNTPLLDEFIAFGPGFNDAQVDRRSDQTWADTLEEYRTAYERVADVSQQVTEDLWWRVGTIPWYGPEYSLDDLVTYQFYGHKREHCAQIDVYRDRFSRTTSASSATVTT